MSEEKMATGLESNMTWLNKKLKADQNFDVVYRVIHVGGKNACIYFIDGFCKDELMQKLLQQFMGITAEDMPKDAHEMAKSFVPYVCLLYTSAKFIQTKFPTVWEAYIKQI